MARACSRHPTLAEAKRISNGPAASRAERASNTTLVTVKAAKATVTLACHQ